ncbi:hypothetical protein SUGI_0506470 [Cryptomeria japonica]|nr:hypothetical protein SUGI_0506470 [Cryptomeria japonica]
MASSKSKSNAPVLPLSCFTLQRSLSPTRYFSSASNSSPFNFSVGRSLSPNRYTYPSSVNFDLARSRSPKRNLQARSPVRSVPPKAGQRAAVPSGAARKTCLCSPSNHPGAFRCRFHRNCPPSSSCSSASSNSQLNMRRSAMKNSLVRIGSVEGGDWMKRALTALIRPSSHQVQENVKT